MIDPQHSVAVVSMVIQASEDGAKWAKANWQVLAVCATILIAAGRMQVQIETMDRQITINTGRLVIIEKIVTQLEILARNEMPH